MNTYDHWVTESLADHAVNPAHPSGVLSTIEYARVQLAVDAANAPRQNFLAWAVASRPALLLALLLAMIAVAPQF